MKAATTRASVRRFRPACRTALVCVAMLQVVAGPAFAGNRLLWHDHDLQGEAGHLVTGLGLGDHYETHHDDHDALHAAEHDAHHADEAHHAEHAHASHGEEQHSHAPHGRLLDLPTQPILSSGSVRRSEAVTQILDWDAGHPAAFGALAGPDTPAVSDERRPPRYASGKGAVRILRANHALLI